MRVTLISAGTRGDVAPFAYLADALQKAGHSATLVANKEFFHLAKNPSVELFQLGPNPREALDTPEGQELLKNSSSPWGFAKQLKNLAGPDVRPTFEDTAAGINSPDIVVHSPLAYSGACAAEALGVPSVSMQIWPNCPSAKYPSAFLTQKTLGPLGNRFSHYSSELLTSYALHELVDESRQEVFGLPPLKKVNFAARQRGIDSGFLLAFSQHVVKPAKDWPSNADQCGYLMDLTIEPGRLDPKISEFIAADRSRPTIYFGLGSMMIDQASDTIAALQTAVGKLNIRAVVERGWGQLDLEQQSDDILFVDDPYHPELFNLVDAVVHHGGAGTTARGLAAGKPTAVLSIIADQWFWGHRISSLNAGPGPLPLQEVTPEKLTKHIEQLVTSKKFARSADLVGQRIRAENPAASAVEYLQKIHGA